MRIKIYYYYQDDDKDFMSDCIHTQVFIFGHKDYKEGMAIDLPFEDDYPRRLTEIFINGMMFVYPGEVDVDEIEVADESYGANNV